MVFDSRTYSVLLVSSSEKFDSAFMKFLPQSVYHPVVTASGISAAKRALLERSYDFIIINTPLPDEYGDTFAVDVTSNRDSVALMIVKSEHLEEIHARVYDRGVYTLCKPASPASVTQALRWMSVTRERLRSMDNNHTSIDQKMAQIRLSNRAKWLLIEKLGMTEDEAHHYIEKKAMDSGMTKAAVTEEIITRFS